MKKSYRWALSVSLVLGPAAAPARADHCPKLIKECRALVNKIAAKPGIDKAVLAKAEIGCEEAMELHRAGKHKASVIKAGEAISAAGAAAL